jgi:hypothetical protein
LPEANRGAAGEELHALDVLRLEPGLLLLDEDAVLDLQRDHRVTPELHRVATE